MLKLALGQLEIIPGRPDCNTAAMLDMIQEAKNNHANMIIFPELAISGSLLGDTWQQTSFIDDCVSYGQDIIDASDDLAIAFGNVAVDQDDPSRLYNALFIAHHGKLCQAPNNPYPFYIKADTAANHQGRQPSYFTSLTELVGEQGANPSDYLEAIPLVFGDTTYTFGCSIGDVDALRIIEADCYITIAASPFVAGKQSANRQKFLQLTTDTNTPLAYVNAVGIQNSGKTVYPFDGASVLYNNEGKLLAHGDSFRSGITIATLDSTPIEPLAPLSPIGEIHRALHFGAERFLAQIGVKKIVIGASGGIDSAVAAALYTDVVGADNVLLVNMPSRFNSDTTKNLSRQLAENLGCHYAIMPIQDIYTETVEQLKTTPILHTGKNSMHHLTVSPFVQENIQARDRSSRILAGIAAAWGGVFTCNANKAETSIGYCTLYGDSAGFLAALADLWKHQVYELAYYFNTTVFGREVIPQGIIDIVPSAELSDQQCVDEGKGDPLIYPYHDYLFRAFIEQGSVSTPADILAHYADGTLEQTIGCEKGLVSRIFPTAADFIADLERWWRQYTGMAVAKRIQSPPLLAVTAHPYGTGHPESQNTVYYTRAYRKLKEELLQQ